jgi:hypothetical protein
MTRDDLNKLAAEYSSKLMYPTAEEGEAMALAVDSNNEALFEALARAVAAAVKREDAQLLRDTIDLEPEQKTDDELRITAEVLEAQADAIERGKKPEPHG